MWCQAVWLPCCVGVDLILRCVALYCAVSCRVVVWSCCASCLYTCPCRRGSRDQSQRVPFISPRCPRMPTVGGEQSIAVYCGLC